MGATSSTPVSSGATSKLSTPSAAAPEKNLCCNVQGIDNKTPANKRSVIRKNDRSLMERKTLFECEETQQSDDNSYAKKLKQDSARNRSMLKRKEQDLKQMWEHEKRRPEKADEDIKTARKYGASDIKSRMSSLRGSIRKGRKKGKNSGLKGRSEKRKISLKKYGKEKQGKIAPVSAAKAAPLKICPPNDEDYTNFEPTNAVSRPARVE